MNNQLTKQELAVYTLISTSEKKITQQQIANHETWLGCHPEHEQHLQLDHIHSTLRNIRQIIRNLRIKHHYPIISDKYGYWMPQTKAEVDKYMANLEKVAKAQAKAYLVTYRAMQKNFNVHSEYFENAKLF